MGIEITVIDDSGIVGGFAAATRIGEVVMTDVPSMVSAVIAKADGKKMSRLNILDHGSPKSFQIGTDNINSSTFPAHTVELVKLAGHFDKGGFVHLQHCQIGQNTGLMAKLAALLGVPVYAGKNYQNPVLRRNVPGRRVKGWLTGWTKVIPDYTAKEEYVRVDPGGAVTDPAPRP